MNHLGTDPRSPVGRDGAMQSPVSQCVGDDDDDIDVVNVGRPVIFYSHHPVPPYQFLFAAPVFRWELLLHGGLILRTHLIPLKRPHPPSDSYLNSLPSADPTEPPQRFLLSDLSESDPRGRQEGQQEVGQHGETNLRMKERRTGEAELCPLLRTRLLDGGMVKSSIICARCNHINLTVDSDGVYIGKEFEHDETGKSLPLEKQNSPF